MIRLSIIIPFYNVEQYIAQCLDSVYDQDIPEQEYEVICVDDCGPDQSRKIVERYANIHSNLRIVTYEQNRKLGGARNAGLDVAQGKYIWFVDSDDWIEKNIISRLLDIAEGNALDMLHFNHTIYPISSKETRCIDNTEVMTGTDMFFDTRFKWDIDLITAWCKLYRLQFLEDKGLRFAEHIMYEDNDYAIRAFAEAERVMHTREVVYHYRQNTESITRTKITVNHLDYWVELSKRLLAIKQQFEKEHKDERYLLLLSRFIRYELSCVFDEYCKLDRDNKRIARKMLRNKIGSELRSYMSVKKYVRLKLGLI